MNPGSVFISHSSKPPDFDMTKVWPKRSSFQQTITSTLRVSGRATPAHAEHRAQTTG